MKKRNPTGLPHNNKMATPSMVPLPLLLQHKEGRSLQKERLNIPLQLMGNICLDLREGEIDGILTPSPLSHTLPCPLCTTQYSHVRVHILFTLSNSGCTLAPSLLFTNVSCACAMLHIPLSLASLGFPPMDENLHNNISYIISQHCLYIDNSVH